MHRYKHVVLLIAVALLAIVTAVPAAGQTTVYSGQTSELSVVEVPGETYSWQLFNDHNGVNFATAFGNCPPSSAFLVDDITTGPVVNVTWLEPGTYFYKVTAYNECTNNVKIGMVTVLPLIDGEIELRAEDNANSCVGAIVGVPIMVVDNFNEIASFRIQLTFNSSVIKFNGFTNINKKLAPQHLTYVEVSPGVLNLNYYADGALSIDDEQILFDVVFQGIAEGRADIKWNTLECSIRTIQNVKTPALYVVRDLYKVSKNPAVSITQSNTVVCQGGPISMSAQSTDNQNITYKWIDPYNNVLPGSEVNILSANPMDSGKYRLIATNDQSCETKDEVNIVVNPKPILQIATADTICFRGSYLLDAGGNYSEYDWNDGESNSPTYLVEEPGVYWVKVVDKNGCEASQSVMLRECTIEALVPNAFTPNGDNLNETFKPIFKGCELSNFTMSIYNRWGELIFTTNNKDEGWDGTSNGILMQAGTYVYVISYEVPSYVTKQGFNSPLTGKVTLLR